jgi:hypothetical protein
VENVEIFKFLGINLTDKLKRSTHTDSVVNQAQQRPFNLMGLKIFGLAPKTLRNFNRCTIESILSGFITAWYDNYTTRNRRVPQRVMQSNSSAGAHCLPSRTHTALDVTGRQKRLSRTSTT